MRVLVLGGKWFLGRRVVERLHERGDSVLVVHRGRSEPKRWIPVEHLHTDRHRLAEHADTIAEFSADTVVDSCPLTGAGVVRSSRYCPRYRPWCCPARTSTRRDRATSLSRRGESTSCLMTTTSLTSRNAGCAAVPSYCACR
jgi:NAD dependent epimerase/dehydratase family enzyme